MNAFLEGLLPWVVALWVVDGVVRAWPGEVLFHAAWGRAFRLAGPGFRLALPFPASDAFALSGEAVFVGLEAVAFPAREVRFDGPLPSSFIEEPIDGTERFHADDRSVARGRRTLFSVGSPEAASLLARRFEALRAAPAASRADLRARWADEAFDQAALGVALGRYREASASGRVGGWALLAVLFVGLPLSLLTPLGRWAPPAAWLLLGAGAWAYAMRGVGRLMKECGLDRGSRAVALLHFVFLPVSAARVWAASARHLLVRFDLLTAAAALLDQEGFAACARRELARIGSLPAECASRTVREALGERERRARRLIEAVLGASELPPPAREDAAASLFCPLCTTEFREGVAVCGDCGQPLEPFGADRGPTPNPAPFPGPPPSS